MNFSELCAEVINLTGRNDLVAETESAVKSATLKMHHSDFYTKDLKEAVIQFSSPTFVQSFEYATVVDNWRALKYIRKLDKLTNTPGKLLSILDVDEVFDAYGLERQDVAYTAGNFIQIKSSTIDSNYLVGYYAQPTITKDGYNSWVSSSHPYAIVYDAAATVFKIIGKDEESAQIRTLVAEQIAMIKLTNISPTGY